MTRLLDYSKYKYEQEQEQKQARKHQQQGQRPRDQLCPTIADHDDNTKKGHVERFLWWCRTRSRSRLMFRGREQAHP